MPEPVKPFNDIARDFDPMMPQDHYNKLRDHYFHSFVQPGLKAEHVAGSYSEFIKQTERPRLWGKDPMPGLHTPDIMLPVVQGAVTANKEMMSTVSNVAHAAGAEKVGKFIDQRIATSDDLLKKIDVVQARDGHNLQGAIAKGMGVLGGAAAEIEAMGPAGAEKAGAELVRLAGAEGARAALLAKVTKGGLAFGTFEAINAKRDPGVAFLKGAAIGAAWETGLAPTTAVRAFKGQPVEVDEVVKDALQEGYPKVNSRADQAIAKGFKTGADTARKEMYPAFVNADPKVKGVRAIVTDSRGVPKEINVRPYAEGEAVAQIQSIVQSGGTLDKIIHHPEEGNAVNRFLKMTEKAVGSDNRVFKVAPGSEQRIVDAIGNQGHDARVAAPGKVTVEVKPQAPSPEELSSSVDQLEGKDPVSKAQIKKGLATLWDPRASDKLKYIAAKGLAFHEDVDELMPTRWAEERQKAFKQLGVIEDETTKVEPKKDFDLALEKAANASPYDQDLTKGLTDIDSEFKKRGFDKLSPDLQELLRQPGVDLDQVDVGLLQNVGAAEIQRAINVVESSKVKNPGVMEEAARKGEIDRELLGSKRMFPSKGSGVEESGVKIKARNGHTSIRMPRSQLSRIAPGADALFTHPTGRALQAIVPEMRGLVNDTATIPTIFYRNGKADPGVVFHENLHFGIWQAGGTSDQAFIQLLGQDARHVTNSSRKAASGVAAGIARDFSDVYKDKNPESLLEEAYAHAAQALRYKNLNELVIMGHDDTSTKSVIQMVHEFSKEFHDKLAERPDWNELRMSKNRFEHLERISSPDRIDGILQATDFRDMLAHMGPGEEFSIAEANGTVHSFADRQDALNWLEETDGSVRYPSYTTGLELRGLLGRVMQSPAGKRSTMPDIQPVEGRWTGWGAVSSLWRPMPQWVDSISTKLNEGRDVRIPLYEKYKGVDEAFQHGQTWIDNQREAVAQHFKGVGSKKLYDYFQFLGVEPKLWDRMAPKLNMSEQDMKNVQGMYDWLRAFDQETHLGTFNYLLRELPVLKGSGYDTKFVWPEVKDPSKASTFYRGFLEGRFDPKDQHAGRFVNFLLHEGFERKFTERPLAELRKVIDLKTNEGAYVLGSLREPLNNYHNYMRSIPDASQKLMMKTVSDFQGMLTSKFKEINKHLPAGVRLPEEFSYPGSAVNKVMALSYTAGLGLRAAIPIRDMMQVLTTTLPVLGPTKFIKGLMAATHGGFGIARDAGALLTRHNVGELYGDIFSEIPVGGNGIMDKALKLSNQLLAPSRWGHNFGRAIGYLGEFDTAKGEVQKFRAGAITSRQFLENTSLWSVGKETQTHYIMMALDKGIEHEDVARKIALEIVDQTLWPYRRGTQPLLLRTGIGRVFGQYGAWPLNYLEYLKRMSSKVTEHPQKAMQSAGLWMATNYAATQAMNGIGADAGKWFFLSPAGYGGGPHWELAQALMVAPENSEKGRQARKTVLEYPLNFVPAMNQTEQMLKIMQDPNAFDSGGMPSNETMLRLLGFKVPHGQQQQELDIDQRLRKELGFNAGRKE